jgi:hypothetical protein
VQRQQAAHNNVAPVHRLFAILALGWLLSVLPVAPASAAALTPVADCQLHGQLTQSYTAAQLRNALATMPADVREYSDCYDILQRALYQKIGKLSGGGSSGGGGSFLPTWLIVVLAVLVLAGAGLGVAALRNRGGDGPPGADG